MTIQQLAHELSHANTVQQAQKALDHYLVGFGIHHYAFTYYSGHVKTGRQLRYDCVSTALRPWHAYYLEQGYADVDRTLQENQTAVLPQRWDVHQQLKNAKNHRERRIREESIAFGVDKGLSIPVHGPDGDFVSLTLHQFRDETCLKKSAELQFEWLAAAQIYYHAIRKILGLDKSAALPYRLTKREEQCLMMTAQGFRVEKIAKELNITPRTVNFHIQNANKKLGTNNKYQASYKFLAK